LQLFIPHLEWLQAERSKQYSYGATTRAKMGLTLTSEVCSKISEVVMPDTIQKSPDKKLPDISSDIAQAPTKETQAPIFSEPILCCYVNTTNRIQVGRLSHLPEGEWEHIFFPGQHFMFEAPPEANLVIYKSPSLSMTVPDDIPCGRLQVPSS
jgi:hypothetical protein